MANNHEENKLIDPMAMEESAEELQHKKEEWMKIAEELFDLNPDATDAFTAMYKEGGVEFFSSMLNDLHKFALVRGIINDEIIINITE